MSYMRTLFSIGSVIALAHGLEVHNRNTVGVALGMLALIMVADAIQFTLSPKQDP